MSLQREQQRQQWRLRQLFERPAAEAGDTWLASAGPRGRRGLQAYEANAGASAERALRAAFPTVEALLGEEAFAGLARVFWLAEPPVRGDLGCWGEALAGFIESRESLGDWPYLGDCARLDWALAQAERCTDAEADLSTLGLLGEVDPSELRLRLAPGSRVVRSDWPVVTLWRAHHGPHEAEPFAAARAALAERRAEQAMVWRQGWRARVEPIADSVARWTEAVLGGCTLGAAFDAAGEAFAFEPWLVQALRQGWLQAVRRAV